VILKPFAMLSWYNNDTE